MPPRASCSSLDRLLPYVVGLAVPLESGFQTEGSIAQTGTCRQTHRHYPCPRAHRAQSRPDGATYFPSCSADPYCPLRCEAFRRTVLFLPSHMQDCSWAVLWAEVIHMAMYFDESCKKSRCRYGEGTRRRSMFLSSYALQSRLEEPDHSSGKLFRKLSAAFLRLRVRHAVLCNRLANPCKRQRSGEFPEPPHHPGQLMSLSLKLSGPSSQRQSLLG